MGQSQSGIPPPEPSKPISFDCSVCMETKTNVGYGPRQIEGSPICEECVREGIVPLFEAAIDSEHEYPPRWGGARLEAKDFANALSGDFVDRYERIENEYQTSGHRTYCKHVIKPALRRPRGAIAPFGSAFYSNPVEIQWMREAGEPTPECGHMLTAWSPSNDGLMRCYHCYGKTCLRCETPLAFRTDHECKPVDYSTLEQIFEDQVRGEHYQICPGKDCSNTIAIADGCNALRCNICDAQFCFLCGELAEHDSDHWALGKDCPRWNQPGTSNAYYDPPQGDDEHRVDDEAQDEALQVFMELVVERAEARLQADNGQNEFDAQMFNDILQELRMRGFNNVIAARTIDEEDAEVLWDIVRSWQARHQDQERDELVMAEFRQVAERYGFDPQRDSTFDYAEFVSTTIHNMRLHRVRANRRPTPGERIDYLEAHYALMAQWDDLDADACERELPLMSRLMREYLDTIPHWLQETINAA